jgi:phosphate-selective porin OprO/OprP
VAADEKSVAQEILEILRANNQIGAQQYEALLSRATAEEAARQADTEKLPNGFRLYWKEGVKLDGGDDGQFKFSLGGRIETDWAYFDADNDVEDELGELGNGTEFRRARFYMTGTVYDRVEFKAEYDFAGGEVAFKDVYLQLNELPWVGSLQIGHFKEPFSLTEMTSGKHTMFMERALLKDTFSPGRNMGLRISHHALNERLTWAVGGFREADDQGAGFSSDATYNVTTRFTGLPWYYEQGRKLIHLGISYSHKFRHDDNVRFRARPEAHLSPVRFVDTGNFAVDGVDLITPEFAWVYGPLSLQAEYAWALVSASEMGSPDFSGYYVQASYFLTGEHRAYKRTQGAFTRIWPKRNFDGAGGWGAWEIATRYSHVDLRDGVIRGGELGGFTSGLNWYLNPHMRIMANYVLADLDSIGNTNIFQMRAQVDF